MIDRILHLLQKHRHPASLLSELIRNFRLFKLKSSNKGKEFTNEATKKVLGELQMYGADMTTRLLVSTRPNYSPLSSPSSGRRLDRNPSNFRSKPRFSPKVNGVEMDLPDKEVDPHSQIEDEFLQGSNYHQQELDEEMPLVNAMNGTGPWEICANANHDTVNCEHFHWLNKSENMRRRINQARLIHKIKYQELQRKSKATSPSKSTFGTNGTRPPIPPKANLPPLQQPKVSAISSDISKQFHEETGFPD